MCLMPLINMTEGFLVTEKMDVEMDLPWKKIYRTQQINRKEKWFFVRFVKLIIFSSKIILCEKPDIIISTGALVTVPLCVLGKLFRKKLIFIESFARVNKPSLSGKLIYPFADLFMIQWETLKKYYPKAIYVGGIF